MQKNITMHDDVATDAMTGFCISVDDTGCCHNRRDMCEPEHRRS